MIDVTTRVDQWLKDNQYLGIPILTATERANLITFVEAIVKETREATMDEFGIIHGEAAGKFLAAMDAPVDPEQAKFLTECEEVYRKNEAKRHRIDVDGVCQAHGCPAPVCGALYKSSTNG